MTINYIASSTAALSFSLGKGFHSNDSRVINSGAAQNILPSATGADLGLLLKPLKNFMLQTTIWGLLSQQEFVYVGDAGIVEPSSKSRRMGIEFSGRYQLKSWLTADFDINLTHARSFENGAYAAYIPLAPWLTSTAGFTMTHPKGIQSSLRYRYLADRPADAFGKLIAKGYFLLDAAVNYNFRSNTQLGLSMQNVLGVQWKEAQFETTSQMRGETNPITEINITPGSPRAIKIQLIHQF